MKSPSQDPSDLKVPLHLVPASSMIYEALALREGAEKYGTFNWRTYPMEAMTCVGKILRHLFAWVDGEEYDKSGEPHLGHAKADLAVLIDCIETGNLIDNRPPVGSAADLLHVWERSPAPSIVGDEKKP